MGSNHIKELVRQRVFLGLGSNLGERKEILKSAMKLLEKLGDDFVSSSFYESRSWGYEDPDLYLNCVCSFETELSAEDLHQATLEVEAALGRETNKRKTGEPYRPRLIDVDILFYGNHEIRTESLIVPHPHFHERNFTLKPMAEIFPDFEHPTFRKSILQLLQNSPDGGELTMID
jgi:2-amino-4-hydroxy-6-hydroxymethyldihydropteridine diphosphokinase